MAVDAVLKIPLVLEPQPEGGYTVTSPLLPELLTEGESVQDALANVPDALAAALEIYEDLGRALPEGLRQPTAQSPIRFEALLPVP